MKEEQNMTDTTTQPAETDYSQLFESKSFWLFVVGVLFSLPLIMSFMRPKIEQKPILGTIQEFKLQNQDGRNFSNRDIAGSVLLVNFVFTTFVIDTSPVETIESFLQE